MTLTFTLYLDVSWISCLSHLQLLDKVLFAEDARETAGVGFPRRVRTQRRQTPRACCRRRGVARFAVEVHTHKNGSGALARPELFEVTLVILGAFVKLIRQEAVVPDQPRRALPPERLPRPLQSGHDPSFCVRACSE